MPQKLYRLPHLVVGKGEKSGGKSSQLQLVTVEGGKPYPVQGQAIRFPRMRKVGRWSQLATIDLD